MNTPKDSFVSDINDINYDIDFDKNYDGFGYDINYDIDFDKNYANLQSIPFDASPRMELGSRLPARRCAAKTP